MSDPSLHRTSRAPLAGPSTPDAALDGAIEHLLKHAGHHLVVGAPLGLGKPHRVLNALYARIAADPGHRLTILSALSLSRPRAKAGLERRFLAPFVDRHFGSDFEDPAWFLAQQRDALPPHIEVQEFYLPSGALLGSKQAQQHYASLNYTHAARGIAARGCNIVVQSVARGPDGRLSLSCNPDLTFDLIDALAARGLPRPLMVAEVHPDLPYVERGASVDAGFFDIVLEPGPLPPLFAVPRQPVSLAEFAIGLHASTLVKDGGTLQIGIGALSDALTHALVLRHTRNADYRRILDALWQGAATSPLVRDTGGLAPFEQCLFGCSEMVMDGFRVLAEAGVLKRAVVPDAAAQGRLDAGTATAADIALREAEGEVLHGGFFLGSRELYRWLQGIGSAESAFRLRMTRISEINQLGTEDAPLRAAQRRHARFINTTMMQTVLGAAVSDGLADGRVVSGVGGQYNFVAMGHALPDARSILLFRAVRESGAEVSSSLLWHYGHTTIPRHLRDVAISEYGIADLRDQGDADCIRAMLAIGDARFMPELAAKAVAAGKLDRADPSTWARNTPEAIEAALAPFRREGLLPEYPIGSDFTPVEQDLVRALGRLKRDTATRGGKARALWGALWFDESIADAREDAAVARMGYDGREGWREALERKLLRAALRATAD
ncbi:acetyl-CoA hydrolase/transferase C-terminal domain-containing protein [Silanimonas sp.]|uniref:acetyl-CoA hydrolase/transferase C-terminal domain-containing protein n=1 Tax=Silanimonas sp. TaxID=1929290 RepID=UPI0022BDF02B|nr:acetyl-CoA hydrolase/transferase C-terminal domain-containing protein [Silanimonas sp.]MCZ8114284.1 acetyl-CoA hydrolase [Silanimonas sp.]